MEGIELDLYPNDFDNLDTWRLVLAKLNITQNIDSIKWIIVSINDVKVK